MSPLIIHRPQQKIVPAAKASASGLLICLTLLLGCDSKKEPPAFHGPRLNIDQTEQYCRMQLPGDSHLFKFTLTNQGDEPLSILDVKKSCGCISFELPDREMLPGASQVLCLKASQDRYGTTSQWTILKTNEPAEQALHKLTVKMEIAPKIVCTPSAIDQVLYTGRSKQRTVTVAMYLDARITAVEKSAEWIKSLEHTANPTNKIMMTISSESLPPGRYSDNIVIRTDAENLPKTSIPVSLSVKSEVSIIPDFLFLGNIDPAQPRKPRFVKVSLHDKAPEKMTVTLEPPGLLSYHVEQESDGARLYVDLADTAFTGRINATMNIRIDGFNNHFSIPITGYVKNTAP